MILDSKTEVLNNEISVICLQGMAAKNMKVIQSITSIFYDTWFLV